MILVTGHTGFVGTELMKLIPNTIGLEDTKGLIDICDKERVSKVIKSFSGDAIIHMAAQSDVKKSFESPEETFKVNFWGTYNLLMHLKENEFKGKLLIVSSGDVYGKQKETIHESLTPAPQNPYAISKYAAECLTNQFIKEVDFSIIIARPFNHTGKGQNAHFVLPSFARQLKNSSEEVVVGNIQVERTFLHVNDVISAYKLLLQHGKNGEIYNIASSKSYLLSDILQTMIDKAGKSITIKQDQDRMRSTDITKLSVDNSKIKKLGWKENYTIEDIIDELIKKEPE